MPAQEKLFFVNVHTHADPDGGEDAVSIRNLFPEEARSLVSRSGRDDLFYSVGLHPWRIGSAEDNAESIAALRESVSNARVIAVGECGLDKVRSDAEFGIQREIFMVQAQIAEKISKPLLIHAVRSYPEIISARKTSRTKSPWIVHGFSGSAKLARELCAHGICVSFGKALFFSEKSREALHAVPKDMLFLETDDSSIGIRTVYLAASELLGLELSELQRLISANFAKTFPFVPWSLKF